MSEMVERVALAIYEHANTQGEEPFDRVSEEMREWFRGHARTAIASMREPTLAQEVAFVNATVNRWATPEGLRDGYRAMIDAALST